MSIKNNKKYSTILTVLGGVGLIATTVSAIKVTPKALELIKDEEKNKKK